MRRSDIVMFAVSLLYIEEAFKCLLKTLRTSSAPIARLEERASEGPPTGSARQTIIVHMQFYR